MMDDFTCPEPPIFERVRTKISAVLVHRRSWSLSFLLLLFTIFIVLLMLYTYGNGFPIGWHWDEQTKAQQILTSAWNFNHPQLMLTATRAVLLIDQDADTPIRIVHTGRWVTACFSAAAVILLALTARELSGDVAGFLAAVFVGTGAFLFGLAHFMKEDPYVLFGLSWFLLMLVYFVRRPSLARVVALGLAAGTATSAKYVGAYTLAAGIASILFVKPATSRSRLKETLVFLACAAGIFLLWNFPLFGNAAAFWSGFEGEFHHTMTGHMGLSSPLSDPAYLEDILLYAGCPLGLAILWIASQRLTSGQVACVLFLCGDLVLLQVGSIKGGRYSLPLIAIIQMLGACGTVEMLRRFGRLQAWIGGSLCIATIAINLLQLEESLSGIMHDSRRLAGTWIRQYLPTTSVIAEDRILTLRTVGIPQVVIELPALDARLPPAKRLAGVNYVAISSIMSARWFMPRYIASQSAVNQREFYRYVMENGDLVLEIPGHGTPGAPLSPQISIYRLGH